MKLSMPKPLHGWRAFAGEVGVIVLGVLLALGAQQLDETVNQRREASATRVTLVREIEETLAVIVRANQELEKFHRGRAAATLTT